MSFTEPDSSWETAGNSELPSSGVPNNAIYPFWADLIVDSQASMHTGVVGSAPDRAFVIEWRDVTFHPLTELCQSSS